MTRHDTRQVKRDIIIEKKLLRTGDIYFTVSRLFFTSIFVIKTLNRKNTYVSRIIQAKYGWYLDPFSIVFVFSHFVTHNAHLVICLFYNFLHFHILLTMSMSLLWYVAPCSVYKKYILFFHYIFSCIGTYSFVWNL